MLEEPFTINKQKVRELNLLLIKKYFEKRKEQLRYFGLPGEGMRDILLWKDFFAFFCAVERGKPGEEFLLQHNLRLSAFKYGISDKLHLLRGELDNILLKGYDDYNNSVEYPFDVIALDYCGGIIYKNSTGESARTGSIGELVRNQALHDKNFLLFLTCNLDSDDQGEIRKVFLDVQRELSKLGVNADPSIQAYLAHPKKEARLKIYVPYLIRTLSLSTYRCETFKPVCYLGNKETHMMNFSFWMERSSKYAAGRPNRQSLVQLLNLPAFECIEGNLSLVDFGIPKIEIS
jgi:hypothetical protein